MFREYFILLLLAHILGDFYFQTKSVAEKKEESTKWVFIHCLCYWATIMLILIPVMSWKVGVYGTIAAVTHTVIDVMKYLYITSIKLNNKMTMFKQRNIFFADQILHLICLMTIVSFFILQGGDLYLCGSVSDFLNTIGISGVAFVSWMTALLIIHKPANIAIAKLLLIYKPESNDNEKQRDNNAGQLIGTVERIIILIFISMGQYSAIGLVLTAKSIARYDRISKEKDFAEYYLLGTLISTLMVIIVSFIF